MNCVANIVKQEEKIQLLEHEYFLREKQEQVKRFFNYVLFLHFHKRKIQVTVFQIYINETLCRKSYHKIVDLYLPKLNI